MSAGDRKFGKQTHRQGRAEMNHTSRSSCHRILGLDLFVPGISLKTRPEVAVTTGQIRHSGNVQAIEWRKSSLFTWDDWVMIRDRRMRGCYGIGKMEDSLKNFEDWTLDKGVLSQSHRMACGEHGWLAIKGQTSLLVDGLNWRVTSRD